MTGVVDGQGGETVQTRRLLGRAGDLLDELLSRLHLPIADEKGLKGIRAEYWRRVGNPSGKTRKEMLIVLGALGEMQQDETVTSVAVQDERMS